MCHYSGAAGTQPSRIDGLLAGVRVCTTLQCTWAMEGTDTLSHMPLGFEVAVEAAAQRGLKFLRPQEVGIPERDPKLQAELACKLLAPLGPVWGDILAALDVDATCEYCTLSAEEALLTLAQPNQLPDIDPVTLLLDPHH